MAYLRRSRSSYLAVPLLSRRTAPLILLAGAVLAYAVYFSYLTLVRYAAFEARALDMGNLDQAIWNTAHGRWFHLTNQSGTVNRLSLHVEPILIPISWLYRLYPGPPTLLVLQAVVVALGALPLFALARFKLHSEWLALGFAVAFLLNPSIQAANWLEFHPVTLVPTLLMASFYFLVRGRIGWYAIFAILAASCKEEVALLVFMIGLYATVVLRRVRLGMITMVASALWAFLAVFVIQSTFAAGNIHWNRYAYLGETPSQMVLTLITQPEIVLAQLQSADALRYLAQLLLPVGFVALLAPEILLLAFPSLALNLLADFAPMHQVFALIYAAPIVPFVMIASVYGVVRLAGWVDRRTNALHTGTHSVEQTPSTKSGAELSHPAKTAAGVATLIVVGSALFAQALVGYLPGGGNYRRFTVTPHHQRAASVIAQIPADAKVSAQDRLNPHVSGRETVYIFPRIDDADTVFVDVTGPAWPQHPNDLRSTVDQLLDSGFGVTAAEDGYLLLQRSASQDTIPDSFYTAWQPQNPMPANQRQVDFADSLRLVDYRVETDSHDELIVKLYWEVLSPINRDIRFYVAFADADGDVLYDTLYYQPVAVLWYPTSMWESGSTVLVQTLPWTLDTDQFTLYLGLYEDGSDWTQGERLPVTQVAPPLPRLDDNTLVRLGGYRRTSAGDWRAIPLTEEAADASLDAQFGDQIVLDGASIPHLALAAGERLDFSLYWHASQPIDTDYTAFAHVLDQEGKRVAQLDWQPHDAIGLLPTTAWIPDQPVVDTQSILLPENLRPGSYRLVVGLYNWVDGQRLPAYGSHAEPGDVVTVAIADIE